MERRHTFVSMLSRVAGVCLLFFSLSSFAVTDTLQGTDSDQAHAYADCISYGSVCNGPLTSPSPLDGVDRTGYVGYYYYSSNFGGYNYWFIWPGTLGPTCTVPSGTSYEFSGTGSFPVGSVCDASNCLFNYTGVGVRLVSANTWTMTGTSTGTYCSTVTPAVTSTTSLPSGGTGCSKQTLVNGQIQYNCGDLSGQIKCNFVNGNFQCSGGSAAAGAKCWTGTDGVINCIGAGEVPSTTPIATQTQKTSNPDGTSSSTVTQMLPGGGSTTTTTTYDSSGTPTGTTTTSDSPVDSGTGTGGDGAGGGPGDGTSLAAPDVPSDTIAATPTGVPGLTTTSYLSGSAGCPTDTSATYFGHTFSLSWAPVCNVLDIVYYAMLAGAAFYAATIFYGYVQRGTS